MGLIKMTRSSKTKIKNACIYTSQWVSIEKKAINLIYLTYQQILRMCGHFI